jgi:hypothetical protein
MISALMLNSVQKKQKVSSRSGGTKAQRFRKESLCVFLASLFRLIRDELFVWVAVYPASALNEINFIEEIPKIF